MKKYKCWVEFEQEIEAKSLEDAIKIFQNQKLELEFCGDEI